MSDSSPPPPKPGMAFMFRGQTSCDRSLMRWQDWQSSR